MTPMRSHRVFEIGILAERLIALSEQHEDEPGLPADEEARQFLSAVFHHASEVRALVDAERARQIEARSWNLADDIAHT